MVNVIATIALIAILGGACYYIWKERKKGIKCIGCPNGASCSGSCSSCGGDCHSHEQK